MARFHDDTVRLHSEVYKELQRLIEYSVEHNTLDLSKPCALKALELARGLGLTGALIWMEQHRAQYEHGVYNGLWGLNDAWTDGRSFAGDVICKRIGTVGTTALTNVPRTVISHSPTGHEWGYRGSGPHDLALDILNWFVPPKRGDRVPCHYGYSSRFAWQHHHAFCLEKVAAMPFDGGEIGRSEIQQWIGTRQGAIASSQ